MIWDQTYAILQLIDDGIYYS